MAKLEWGGKHTCQHCGAKYYDLQRSPAVCPKCGTEFNPDALLRSRRSKPAPADRQAVAADAAEPVTDTEEEDAEEEDEALAALAGETDELADDDGDDEDDELIEDASELGEDDDDMAEVLVGDDEREDT